MASITPHKKGWRAQVRCRDQRDSAVFSTKAEAKAWASERETTLRRASKEGINTEKTVKDTFDRYAKEVSPSKKGGDWEITRLAAIERHKVGRDALGDVLLHELTADMLGRWRDLRLADGVSGSTVNRDFALLSHVFTTARREWKWIVTNPLSDVRRPPSAQPRDRLISDEDIAKICQSLGFTGEVRSKSDRVAVAFLFAIETAMRAGEICALRRSWLHGSVARLPAIANKNGIKRDVALSSRALELLKLLPEDGDEVFGMTSAQLDALFRKGRNKALVGDLTFHDTRHLAITRLARKLSILELARMVGHRDLAMLQIYYNETAEEIAKKLD